MLGLNRAGRWEPRGQAQRAPVWTPLGSKVRADPAESPDCPTVPTGLSFISSVSQYSDAEPSRRSHQSVSSVSQDSCWTGLSCMAALAARLSQPNGFCPELLTGSGLSF